MLSECLDALEKSYYISTHSSLIIVPSEIVCICGTFGNNLVTKNDFAKC